MRPCALVLTTLAASSAFAGEVVVPQAPPVVMMIRAATNPAQQKRERKLYDELALALDGFMLMAQDAEQSDFHKQSLSDQLASVLPVAQKNDAQIVVWLGFPLANQVMLHVVALGSGRALVRTIESDRSPVAESTLALMARELLGTAYLFDPPKSVPLEVRNVVQSVRKQIDAVQPAPPPPPVVVAPAPKPEPIVESGRWAVWLRAESGAPLAGQVDAAPSLGLSLGLERRLPARIDVAAFASGSYAAIARPDVTSSALVTLGGSLTAFRGFGDGPLTAGPWLGAGLHWASFDAGAGARVETALPRFAAGVQSRVDVAHGPALNATLSLAWQPLRAELRTTDSQVLFRSASLELHLAVAVGWQFR